VGEKKGSVPTPDPTFRFGGGTELDWVYVDRSEKKMERRANVREVGTSSEKRGAIISDYLKKRLSAKIRRAWEERLI